MRVTEPSERRPPGERWIAAACLLIVAYTGLSHYCNTHDAGRMGAVLALVPLLAAGAALLGRSPWIALPAALLSSMLLYDVWPLIEKHFSVVYLFQECGMYGLLAGTFWRSLGAGHVPLCTQLADRIHGPLTAAERQYSRRVTLAWAIFFSVLATLIAALFVWTSRATWSMFVNFVALPLVGVMFAAEYAIRRRALPDTSHRGIMATVRIFLASR